MSTFARNSIIVIIVLVLIAGGWWLISSQNARQAKLNVFAQCIADSGAKFYGAFWCPHCQVNKALFNTFFGSAEKYLPYVECSTPDTNGEMQVCKDENIKGYPTWKFADGTRQEGEVSLEALAKRTGCALPN